MPAFTFEKIPPEKIVPKARGGAAAGIEKKPRGVIFQLLDRLSESRAKRALRGDKSAFVRRVQTPRD